MMFKVELKNKKQVKSVKRWIAWKLVALATKIYPDSDEVKEFQMAVMTEMVMKGMAVIKSKEMNHENN